MGFLDNSGDIILDAVLTTEGRRRMARGDGSFKITHWAPGDNEINYANYNANHPSGSAYYDLEILKTPILEPTSNPDQLINRLMTVSRNDLLYLPIMKLVTGLDISSTVNDGRINGENYAVEPNAQLFYVTVDLATSTSKGADNKELYTRKGVIRGDGIVRGAAATSGIMWDQGLDTLEIPQSLSLDAGLVETQYQMIMDGRLGAIANPPTSNNTRVLSPNFTDQNRQTTYYVSLNTNPNIITRMQPPNPNLNPTERVSVINGPLGTRGQIGVRASTEMRSSDALFTRLGQTVSNPTIDGITYTGSFRTVDTVIKVVGMTTGFQINVPIRYIKLIG